MIFSQQVIKELLQTSVRQRKKLEEIYSLIPSTRCLRRTLCCSMLPEMTLIEALAGIHQLAKMDTPMRQKLIKKIVSYFFVNAVEIKSCPFLNGKDCLIYKYRFFGCRAYGLWSKNYYENLGESSHQQKKQIQKQWENLGILLPQEVIDFHVPYCANVTVDDRFSVDDETLIRIFRRIDELSQHLSQWHQVFRGQYFSDLSFLLSSLIFGFSESVRMKFQIVSDIVKKGTRPRLSKNIWTLPDIFEGLL